MYMVNVGSLPGVANVVFDLDTHAGVMLLLASVRASELTTAEKNEIRDLVFLYTNGGKEQTVRRALEQKITSHNIIPVAQKTTKQVLPPPPTIGKYRVAPTFTVVPAAHPVASPSAPKPVFTADPAWKHEEESKGVAAQPVVEVEVPITPPPTPTPAPVSVPEPVPVAAPEVVAPAPAAAPAPAPDFGDTDAYLQRIREIKALVNEKVGNPVNLVDINNEVGREYMGALLDAMKKINSGSSAASAMKRLEDAYAAVEVALKGHAAVHEPTPTPVVQQEPAPIPVAYEPAPVPEMPPVAPVYAHTTQITDIPPSVEEPAPAFHYEPIANSVPINKIPTPVEPVSFAAFEPPTPPTPAPVVIEPLGTPAVPPARPSEYFSSLADYGEKPQAVPTAAAPLKTTATAGDPLFSPEVDEGLQQLLSEWTIFKKSGLFGTGPKGREHPLFKKMAPLQIPLLLAGRFEGASQEVKQSVTDYMNGWRYEQGLIYQQNETFEHYLRRVIRHILDLQKGK
jgi:hypothetical protein